MPPKRRWGKRGRPGSAAPPAQVVDTRTGALAAARAARPARVDQPRCVIRASYFAHYHRWRTHLPLAMDGPEPRPLEPPGAGAVIAVPEVGGLHHHDTRRAA